MTHAKRRSTRALPLGATLAALSALSAVACGPEDGGSGTSETSASGSTAGAAVGSGGGTSSAGSAGETSSTTSGAGGYPSAGCSPSLGDLAPGTWRELEGTKMEAVFPDPKPPGNPSAVMGAWSGGTFDTTRGLLLVWGGGHADYSGNEVYAFDMATLEWRRLDEPSSDVGGDPSTFVYPDGKPRSVHTHAYIEYVPPLDRFVSFGGVGPYPDIGTGTKVFAYDIDATTWDASLPDVPEGGGARGSSAVFDPVTGDVWVQTTEGGAQLHRFHTATKTWTSHGPPKYVAIYGMAAIDTQHRKLVTLGGYELPQLLAWDLDAPDDGPTDLLPITQGDKTLESSGGAGFQYHPPTQRFVAWNGGSSVYTLDPETWTWSEIVAAPDNPVSPPAQPPSLVYGRWRYVASCDLFVLALATDQNVFVYRR